jgi:hypothetical protein
MWLKLEAFYDFDRGVDGWESERGPDEGDVPI